MVDDDSGQSYNPFMYSPPSFQVTDPAVLHQLIREARFCNLVTASATGLHCTPLPMFFEPSEGEHGVLYGHVAAANPHWKESPIGHGLAIFMGPDAYISPSWYATKKEHGKVVPTWDYETVHAHGSIEFFRDESRLLGVVTRLTEIHEAHRAEPWHVSDAPEDYIKAMLRAIVDVRLCINRLEGSRKLSQNRSAADRAGVAAGLAASERPVERILGTRIPTEQP